MSDTPESWEAVELGNDPEYRGRWFVRSSETRKAITGWGRVVQTEAHAHLIAAAPDTYDVCETVAGHPAKVREIMDREDIVIDDLDNKMQKFAFTLYNMLVADAVQAERAIAKARGENDVR